VKRRWVPAVAGTAALVVAAATHRGRGQALDQRLYRALNRRGHPVGDAFFKGLTELGSIWASGGGAAVLAAKGRRREALDAFGAAGAMWAVGQVAKKVLRRPRPYHALNDFRLLIGRPRGTSWPSSHPAVLMAFVTVASRDLDLSPGARVSLAGLAGLVGLSRIALGVHYPADVVGGLLIGRGVADLWSAAVSPHLLGFDPKLALPARVSA
jgi:membrane-associated phospholipid phosphatase